MFNNEVTLILQQLSYIALVIICPCVVFSTLRMIKMEIIVENHLRDDDYKFQTVNTRLASHGEHLGIHDSKIHDLEVQNAVNAEKISA